LTNKWQHLRQAIQDVPVGPSLRLFLGLPKTAKTVPANSIPQEKYDQLEEYFLHLLSTGSVPPKDQLSEIICELSAMRCHKSVVSLEQSYVEHIDIDSLDVALAIGVSLFLVSDYASARYYFTKVLTLDPAHVPALTNLGLALRLSGQTDEAVEYIEKALSLSPVQSRLWEELGFCYQELYEEEWVDELENFVKDTRSWRGYSYLAEIKHLGSAERKQVLLQPFYDKGERSFAFLIEYTGVLGQCGLHERVPAVIWQAETFAAREGTDAKDFPWQLLFHSAQAHLAMGEKKDSLTCLKRIEENYQGIPPEVSDMMQSLKKEIEA
jgi:tetratricopeptide (TPR) repeat protein